MQTTIEQKTTSSQTLATILKILIPAVNNEGSHKTPIFKCKN